MGHEEDDISYTYNVYRGEGDLDDIMNLVQTELSEPYIIYTYRYFLHNWSVRLYHPLR